MKTKEEYLKEFDEKFGDLGTYRQDQLDRLEKTVWGHLDVKAFISTMYDEVVAQEREEMKKIIKELRDGEVGTCPDCNPTGKTFYPCWHQDLREEALNQVINSLSENRQKGNGKENI